MLVLPSGHPARVQALIELLTLGSVPVQRTYTDVDGRARLITENPGNYRIKVSAPEIEDTHSPTFYLDGSMYFHSEMVEVKLKEGSAQQGGGPAMVASASLKAPKKARIQYEKGNNALRQRKWQEAIGHLQEAVETYPEYDMAHNDMGVAYMNLGDHQRGHECFEKALAANANSLDALQNMARLHIADRQYAQAETSLNRALSVDPFNQGALMLLAVVQAGGGKLDEAIATARKLHSAPHDAQAAVHVVAARALEDRKLPQDAAAEYKIYLQEDPSGPHAESARRALERIEAARTATSQPN
jgi:tetratricopeptide (TPR) repeat protein